MGGDAQEVLPVPRGEAVEQRVTADRAEEREHADRDGLPSQVDHDRRRDQPEARAGRTWRAAEMPRGLGCLPFRDVADGRREAIEHGHGASAARLSGRARSCACALVIARSLAETRQRPGTLTDAPRPKKGCTVQFLERPLARPVSVSRPGEYRV